MKIARAGDQAGLPIINRFEVGHEHMDDLAVSLDAAADQERHAELGDGAVLLEDIGADDEVGLAALVFEGHEDDTTGGAGALAVQHDASDGSTRTMREARGVIEVARPFDVACRELLAQERDRVGLQREPRRGIIVVNQAAGRERREPLGVR